jgi:L-fuculose-phosphate aldolase
MLMEVLRQEIVEYSQALLRDKLSVGTSGNISVRDGDLIAITPSGVDYDSLTAELITVIDLNGNQVDGPARASTEVPMHLLIYRKAGARAVVHSHPLYATALGLVLNQTPLTHYMLAVCGGPVRVVPYARFGSDELAAKVEAAMHGRNAVLLRNHGATTWGDSLKSAYTAALYLEWTCKLYCTAKALGTPELLSAEEVDAVKEELAWYGRPSEAPDLFI